MKHTDDTIEKSPLANAVDSLEAPRAKHVHYEHLRDRYWMQGDNGRWQCYKGENLKTRLRIDMNLDSKQQDGAPSEVDCELDRIRRQQAVEIALPLAGYAAGPHWVCGTPVLVTDSPMLLQPKEGDHMRFLKRLRRMFGDDHQAELFCGWLRFALTDYYEFLTRQTGRNVGMGLVIGGASGLGKSLLLKLIVECFGGRRAHPAQHAKGTTSFNNDLIRAELQVFDDEGMGDAYSARKEVGDFVKRTVAVDEQRCHPKGKDAFPVKVFWRLVFCLNDEAENLQVLPPLERGVQDKLMMLKATGALLNEAEEHRPRQENWLMLLEEMAWFIRWLLDDFVVEETLLDARFGMRAWHHHDLVDGVDSFAPELRLLDMIFQRDELFDVDEKWEGMARELEVELKKEQTLTTHEARELLRSPGSIGKYLGKLAVKMPEAVQRLKKDGKTKVQKYRVERPAKAPVAASQSPSM